MTSSEKKEPRDAADLERQTDDEGWAAAEPGKRAGTAGLAPKFDDDWGAGEKSDGGARDTDDKSEGDWAATGKSKGRDDGDWSADPDDEDEVTNVLDPVRAVRDLPARQLPADDAPADDASADDAPTGELDVGDFGADELPASPALSSTGTDLPLPADNPPVTDALPDVDEAPESVGEPAPVVRESAASGAASDDFDDAPTTTRQPSLPATPVRFPTPTSEPLDDAPAAGEPDLPGLSDVAGSLELAPPASSSGRGSTAAGKRGRRQKAASTADLRAAVGIDDSASTASTSTPPPKPPRRKRDDGDGDGDSGMSGRALLAIILLGLFLIVVFVLWFLGERNSRVYYIDCGTSQITASQGRSFPPWGKSRLSGARWRAIQNVLELTQCDDASFDNREELEARYRDLLLAQADQWLEGLDAHESRELLPTVRQQLEQAESLSRSSDPESVTARERIGRLLGDVTYWEAFDELETVSQQLDQAAQRLRSAVDKKPAHVSDADHWRAFARHLAKELTAGPPILRPPPPTPDKPDTAGSGPTPGPAEPTAITPPGGDPDEQPAGPGDGSGDGAPKPEPTLPNPPPPGSGTLL